MKEGPHQVSSTHVTLSLRVYVFSPRVLTKSRFRQLEGRDLDALATFGVELVW